MSTREDFSNKSIKSLRFPKVTENTPLKYEYNNENKPHYTNTWSKIIEHAVKDIGEKATGYKIMHIKTSRKTSLIYNFLMYLGVFLGPLAGFMSGIGSILNPDAPTPFPIIATCFGFVSGVVVAITKFGKYEEKSNAHKIAASKYTSLESNIRRQLVMCREDRINASQYLEWVGESFDELFMASPLVANKIYDNYIAMAKKKGLTVPEIYGITINVDDEYEKQKIQEVKNDTEIAINIRDSSVKTIEPQLKGEKEIKRTETFAHYPEFGKYSDGRMNYEMQRMMGFR